MCLWTSISLLALLPFSCPVRADTLTITSTPPGATVEIDGLKAGTTPYKTDYPGGYFHKTHTAFAARLDHSLVLRISMDGYLSQQITLTEGPFEWVSLAGRRHKSYFLLRRDHFEIKLEPIFFGAPGPIETVGHEGPLRPAPVSEIRGEDRPVEARFGTVNVESDPPGAEIYVDGDFVGQTPSSLRLASGRHRIELKSAGRQTWERNLEVLKDSQLALHPALEPSQ